MRQIYWWNCKLRVIFVNELGNQEELNRLFPLAVTYLSSFL